MLSFIYYYLGLLNFEDCIKYGYYDQAKKLYNTKIAEVLHFWTKKENALEIAEFLHNECDYKFNVGDLINSIIYGKLEVFQFICSKSDSLHNSTISLAVYHGRLNIVKYLYEEIKLQCTEKDFLRAIKYNHLDIVKYLYEEIKLHYPQNGIENATYYGYFDMVKYLHEVTKLEFTQDAMFNAIYKGHLDIVKYIDSNSQITSTKSTIESAIIHANECEQYEIAKYFENKIEKI